MLEVHRVVHRNRKSEDDPDHSWAPMVDGKILTNKKRPDGLFLSRVSAETAIAQHVRKAPNLLTIRIVK
jgi:hypothetical protein